MKSLLSWKYILVLLLYLLFVTPLIIFFADTQQSLNPAHIVKVVAGVVLTAGFFLVYKISLYYLLVFLLFLYIKPIHHALFFWILLLLCIYLFEIKKSRLSIRIPYFYSFLLLLVTSIIGLVKSYNFAEGMYFFSSTLLAPFLIYTSIYNSDFTYRHMKMILKYFVFVVGFVAFAGIIIAILYPNDRLGSFWIAAMTINAFYLMGFIISIGFGLIGRSWIVQIQYYTLSIIIFLGMLFTYTRMALLAVGFGLFLLAIKIKKIRVLGLIFLFIIPFLIPSTLRERISLGLLDISLILRMVVWKNSWSIFLKNPLLGIGFNSFYHIAPSIDIMGESYRLEHSHNIYFRYLLELGVIGFLAYFGLVYKSVRKYYIKIKNSDEFPLKYSLFVSILSVLFACLTDVFISSLSIAIIFWMILGFIQKFKSEAGFTVDN